MKLLRELSEEIKPEYIEEGENKVKNLYISGVFMQAVPNKNGRLYSEELLTKEIKRYTEERIAKKQAYGELNHPSGPTINLDRVSHLIESLKMDGKNVIGRAKIFTETPVGQTVKGLLNGGANLGVSSRGLGSLVEDKKSGLKLVQEDFRLVTAADIVADPSAPDAFVQGIMEATEWVFNATTGTWMEQKIEPMAAAVKKMSVREINEKKAQLFEVYLDNLVKRKVL